MANETIKALLMILLLGSLVGATYVPETWDLATFLVRAMAVVWSTMALPDRALQHAVRKCVHPAPISADGVAAHQSVNIPS